MKTIAITKPRGFTMRVLAWLVRATALSFVLFASLPLSADVWVAGDTRMVKIASSGQTLVTVDSVFGRGFSYGVGIQNIMGVDQRNGHVWVSDVNNNRVFELDPDGKPLREITLFSPFGIGIDAKSGSPWTSIVLNEITFPRAVIKLDPNSGTELVRVTGFSRFVSAIAVGLSGEVWIADRFNNQLVVLFGTDEELNGYDASTSSGPHHFRLGGFVEPMDIAIDPGNSSRGGESIWVADDGHGDAVKIASDGTELVRERPTGFFELRYVSVNSRDGSVWVGDPNSERVAKLSALGKEAQNLSIFPTALGVDITDGAVWIGTGFDEEARVVKVDSNGSQLLSISGLGTIRGIGAIFSATVVIGDCNSGVNDAVLPSGRTISDLIAECAKGASNNGQFVSCVAHVTNDLKEIKTISGQQKGAIQSCAAQAHTP